MAFPFSIWARPIVRTQRLLPFAVINGNSRSYSVPFDMHASNAAWIVSTVLGGIGGQYIPAHAFGIDYALIAMFICLLVFQLKSPLHWLTAGVSGALALGLVLIVPGNVHIMVASCLAAGAGAVLKHRFTR